MDRVEKSQRQSQTLEGRGRGGSKHEGGRVTMEARRKWRMKYPRNQEKKLLQGGSGQQY